MANKLLLLDLDGTVRRCKSNHDTFINEPKDQELIPGVVDALNKYVAEGWAIFGITNQGGVMHKHKTLKACIDEQRYTLKLAPQIDRIYFCPDSGDTCYRVSRPLWAPKLFTVNRIDGGAGDDPRYFLGGFRKPQPGMLRLAMNEFTNNLIVELLDATEMLEPKLQMAIARDELGDNQLMPILCVGDMDTDKQAAATAEVEFMWAHDWRGDSDESLKNIRQRQMESLERDRP
ncbi:hypothetical protein H6F86_21260 [Phormidium sp. FACHB-592]|uniref:Polynucleotide kinase n=1 Tax=Stenomitos frigidus AS-A4 TaxID=2933935 RepID=A0ABV0KEU8_9CYAN|nr:hypothetical protein [Phormidium sp. FACHB-592]MBD2076365.1 hypothetical protein [Phormidium sp. FACHB-592]